MNRSEHVRRRVPRSIVMLASAFACVMAFLTFSPAAAGQAVKQRTFASPEDAVRALIDTVKKGDLDGLMTIFGPDAQDVVNSSDPATGRRNREVFTVATAERWRLADDSANRKTLVIGNEDWPFPVPLVKQGNAWRFDTAAGKEEIIARRIGQNEEAAIETCLAYVTAQQRYAQSGHDGKPAGIYATTFQSDPGKENGLYWPAAHGQKRSPLGDLVADAAEDGRSIGGARGERVPLHGYYFKILTAQGPAAQGGAKSYTVNGQMTAGFALVAWPAEYDVTGVMTFIVNQDTVVREKDLGQGTEAAVRSMTAYNPDKSWKPAQ
ncbi:MAG TPA: DUF2950 domain-containing protein [Vicinamibacterales bacterium]|nr:DUF2950 domain-containing protein [Vicinamibacterales bacterium]